MEVDLGGNIDPNHTPSRCMLMQVDWGGKLRVNHINECMASEVDWGAHDLSVFLYPVHIDHDIKPKYFFTQELWGGLLQRTSSTPFMEYLKDSFDPGQIEDGFSDSQSIKGSRSSYSLPDPEQHESS